MRLLALILGLAVAAPAFAQAQEKKEFKSMGAKKAEKKVAPAKAGAQKKAEPKKSAAKKQEPSQDWGRFSSQSKKDETERAQKAARK